MVLVEKVGLHPGFRGETRVIFFYNYGRASGCVFVHFVFKMIRGFGRLIMLRSFLFALTF